MKTFTFKVWCCFNHDISFSEEEIQLALSCEESRALCEQAKECREYMHDLSFVNMCDYAKLDGICKNLKDEYCNEIKPQIQDIIKALKRDAPPDNLFVPGWKDDFCACAQNILIRFPIELWDPDYIYRQDDLLKMKSCFPSIERLRETLDAFSLTTEGGRKINWINLESSDVIQFYEENKMITLAEQKELTSPLQDITVIQPKMIFLQLDAPLLAMLFSEYNEAKEFQTEQLQEYVETSAGKKYKENDLLRYLRRSKNEEINFGIKAKKILKTDIFEIMYPKFCGDARKLLLERYIVQPRKNTVINSLSYQCAPVKKLSLENAWYYEMCTGVSLTLALTALLYDLDKRDKSADCEGSWKRIRKNIFYRILEDHCSFIIACPAVYWRINVLDKIIRSVDDKMQRTSGVNNEFDWYYRARMFFGEIWNKERAEILHFGPTPSCKKYPETACLCVKNNFRRRPCKDDPDNTSPCPYQEYINKTERRPDGNVIFKAERNTHEHDKKCPCPEHYDNDTYCPYRSNRIDDPVGFTEWTVKVLINNFQECAMHWEEDLKKSPKTLPNIQEKRSAPLDVYSPFFLFCNPKFYPYISKIKQAADATSKIPLKQKNRTDIEQIFLKIRNALYPKGFVEFEV